MDTVKEQRILLMHLVPDLTFSMMSVLAIPPDTGKLHSGSGGKIQRVEDLQTGVQITMSKFQRKDLHFGRPKYQLMLQQHKLQKHPSMLTERRKEKNPWVDPWGG